MNFWFEGKGPS